MTYPWAAPVDPAYTAFAAGLKAHLDDTELPHRWRWHPLDGRWYSYDPAHFDLVDVGAAASQKVVVFRLPGQPPTFFGSQLVQYYDATTKAYGAVARTHPHVVWDPITGGWLEARSRGGSPPPKPSWPPQELVDDIAQVRKLVQDKVITPEEGERRIQALIAAAQAMWRRR